MDRLDDRVLHRDGVRIVRRGSAASEPWRCRAEAWTTRDPRIAFAMLLEFERERRAGRLMPAIVVETGPEVDAGFEQALRRHLPWVMLARREDESHPGGEPIGRAEAPSLLSPEELAMLLAPPEAGERSA